MITGINELKTLIKHVSCKCDCKFDSRICNSVQSWNNDKCPISVIILKSTMRAKNIIFGILLWLQKW